MYSLLKKTHPEWHTILENAIRLMDSTYLTSLSIDNGWLPGADALFAAFSQPLSQVKYLLLGESPYPRAASANGYAFWDQQVTQIWSLKGLSKEVNRATSLRNFFKMLLVARGDLQTNLSQEAIATLDKGKYCQTADEFFNSLLAKGFLLLNASLVYSEGKVLEHAKFWRPFIGSVLRQIHELNHPLQLILLGKIAEKLPEAELFPSLRAEHPYNLSFITNPEILAFFKPLALLESHEN